MERYIYEGENSIIEKFCLKYNFTANSQIIFYIFYGRIHL